MNAGKSVAVVCFTLVLLTACVGVTAGTTEGGTEPHYGVETRTTDDGRTAKLPSDAPGSTHDVIRTEHFSINYTDGHRGEAEAIASFADEYYETLFQRFGVRPIEGRIPVRVVDQRVVEDECRPGAAGCVSYGTIFVSSDDRGLFYHELVHRFQAKSIGVSVGSMTPDVIIEGTAEYLSTSPQELAQRAAFTREATDFATENASFDEYADLALFSEYVLHAYGSEGLDVLYTKDHPRELEPVAGKEYPAIIADFYDQLDEQRSRMQRGGATGPAFTYDPFLVELGEQVTFDARTPAAIDALGRSWYNGRVDSYEWDFDGDGDVDATGPTVTRTFDSAAQTRVTLYVTIGGERYEATQTLLLENPPQYRLRSVHADGISDYSSTETYADKAVVRGQTVRLDVSVENVGELTGARTAKLVFNGSVVDSQQVRVGPGTTERVRLAYDVPSDLEPGLRQYQVSVGDRATREKPVYVTERPTVELAPHGGVSVTPRLTSGATKGEPVEPGATLNVSVMYRTEEKPVTVRDDIELYLDGEKVGEKRAVIPPGMEGTTFTVTAPDVPGRYRLRVEIPNDEGVLTNSPETTHSIVVLREERVTRIKNTVVGKCGSELQAYCSLRVTTTDIAERTAVGDPVRLSIGIEHEEDRDGRIAATVHVGDRTRRVTGNRSSDGFGYLNLTETFTETGEYEVVVHDRTVGTVSVVDEVETPTTPTSDAPSPTEAGETPSPAPARQPSASPTGTPGATGDGFGPVVTILAVSSLLVRAARTT